VEIPKDLDLDTSVSVTKPAASQSQPQSLPVPAISAPSGIGLIGPAVRNLLLQYGLNPSQIPASGAHGNLLKGDILRQVVEQKSQPKSQGKYINLKSFIAYPDNPILLFNSRNVI